MAASEASRCVVSVLAGGRGSRLGGDKALVELAGRPLIEYPLAVAAAAGLHAVVVAKRATRLPALDVPVLLEPDEPIHPLLGIVTALAHLDTAPEGFDAVLAVPCDMPLLAASDLIALAATSGDVATLTAGQPFPSLYRRGAAARLREALAAGASMRSTLAACGALAAGAAASPLAHLSVNTPADLAAAQQALEARG